MHLHTLLSFLPVTVLAQLPAQGFTPRAYPTSESPFECAAASWPGIEGNGTFTLKPTEPSDELKSIMSQIDPARINATIHKLVSFGSRHTLSRQNSTTYGIGAARDWIASEFRKYAEKSKGNMKVEVVGYTQGIASRIPFPVRISDVVATLRGAEDPDRIHVVSGHYDSRVTDVMNYWDDSPGADDDASGVAISLELARITAHLRPRATIAYVAVAGEEQGLYGAQFLAQSYKNRSANIAAMFTNDIVGSPKSGTAPGDPHIIRLFAQGPPSTESASNAATRLSIGGENDSPARELARYTADVGSNAATDMKVAIEYRLDRYLRGGDHRPFLEAGYTAARFTEPAEDFDHQHQDVRVEDGVQIGDLPQFCDMEYIARVGRVNAAALWSLANAPGVPTNVRINATVLSNESILYWDADPKEEVAGWEVVWRPTAAPQWMYGVKVPGGGAARTVTVDVSKDNVVFGVRAVGKEGGRSMAVFPFPAS
jgi:hypothetical protein